VLAMAPRHRELFLLRQLKGVRGRKVRFGEAPKPARALACAPQTAVALLSIPIIPAL
jgi:hypothetical protein